MSHHDWTPSTLGHGETMCKSCGITNREAAAIKQWACYHPLGGKQEPQSTSGTLHRVMGKPFQDFREGRI